jgi:hypothetical protein
VEKIKVDYYEDHLKNYANTLIYISKQLNYIDSLEWYNKRIIKDYTAKPYFFYSSWKAEHLSFIQGDLSKDPTKNYTFINNFKRNVSKTYQKAEIVDKKDADELKLHI